MHKAHNIIYYLFEADNIVSLLDSAVLSSSLVCSLDAKGQLYKGSKLSITPYQNGHQNAYTGSTKTFSPTDVVPNLP